MKKIVKKLVAAALALTMVLSMAACSMGDEKKESSDSGKKSDGEVKVGFVVSDMSDAFFAHLIKNIEKYAKEEGVTFTAKECPEISDKITGIENFVQSGCDVIICHVTDADALKDAATSAEDAGVRFMTQISTEHQDSSESTTMNMDMQSVKMQQNGSTITLKRTKKLKLVSATTRIIHSW